MQLADGSSIINRVDRPWLVNKITGDAMKILHIDEEHGQIVLLQKFGWKLGATPLPISHKLPKFERDQIVELAQPALIAGALPRASSRSPPFRWQLSRPRR